MSTVAKSIFVIILHYMITTTNMYRHHKRKYNKLMLPYLKNPKKTRHQELNVDISRKQY